MKLAEPSVAQSNGLVERKGRPEPRAAVSVPTRDPHDRGFDAVAYATGIASVLATLSAVLIVALTRT